MDEPEGHLEELLARVVPGSPLREGLERILRAHLGALVVLGDGPEVLRICSGGFHIDAEMSPQRLSELAKMDGAIVLDREARRIAWANVHLIPDPSAPTTETGTRHRTAERVARSIGVPVVAVSEETGAITLYECDLRRQLQDTDSLIGRANHLLQTLERFKSRLDEVLEHLDQEELAQAVSLYQVAVVLQRMEMVLRVARSVRELITELGAQGRLLRLQLEELIAGVHEERRLVVADYVRGRPGEEDLEPVVDEALTRLSKLPTDSLLATQQVAGVLNLAYGEDGAGELSAAIVPRGQRLLWRAAHQH
ncbi:MAG: DNA integrity scanning diadenylate cyclase DisA [Actinomycetota bacterium]|nr:DNA integrity scanning diadenylate cyclase DisA [Actinomycetota bacterium]